MTIELSSEPGEPLMARFEGDITRKPAMEGNALVPVDMKRSGGKWKVVVTDRLYRLLTGEKR